MKESIILRKVAGVFTACRRGFGMRMVAAPEAAPLSSLAFALCLMLLPVVALAVLALAVLHPHASTLMLATAPAILPRKSRADLDLIIKSAEKLDADWQGKQMPDDVMEKYNALMKEGAELSEAINAEASNRKTMARMRAASEYLGEVPNPILPGAKAESEDASIVGYITPGDLVVVSDEYKKWTERQGWRQKGKYLDIEVKGSLLGASRSRTASRQQGLIALTGAEVKALQTAYQKFETKDLPVFGDLVIAPQRVDRFVQDTRPTMLTLRDVLNVSPTSSNLIQYVAEVSFTSGADIQSEGLSVADTALKGESDIEYELRDAPIRTIATTIPVSEQMLADAPALINRINTRLLHAVRLKEEQLEAYGSGSGLEFAGFFDSDSGVAAATTPSGSPTLIDKIRAAQTDVMTSFYDPSFVWIHPIDWEAIELAKGSDGHYVWAIIRDNIGPRIWSMRVVQGVGCKKAGATERNVLIGDANGAVIYDREQNNIAVGWIDDQFARNLRTIRAEERMTLTIDAPAAFRKINTAA